MKSRSAATPKVVSGRVISGLQSATEYSPDVYVDAFLIVSTERIPLSPPCSGMNGPYFPEPVPE